MKVAFFFLGLLVLPSSLLMAQSSIGGTVFSDANGNGVNDGEAGITMATVYIDSNMNGSLNGGEPTQVTDGAGAFDFTGLGAGTYAIRVDGSTVPGQVLTSAAFVVVNLGAAEDFNNADFGFEAEDPVVGVAKDESHAGRNVVLDFYVENLGNAPLSNLAILDDLDGVFGAGNYTVTSAPQFLDNPGTLTLNAAFSGNDETALISSGGLNVGATASFTVTVELTAITDQGLGNGTYSNQVTAVAFGPSGGMVSDLSDFGTDPDPNGNGDPSDAGEDDPTIIAILQNPRIGVAKNAMLSGNLVTFDFYLENFGNVALSNLSLVDDLNTTFGAGNYSVQSGPSLIDDPGTIVVNGGFNGGTNTELITSGTLAVADTARIRITVNITNVVDLGGGLGVYSNQATAYGEAPNGAGNSDLSDQGVDPDPNGDGNPNEGGENDPTTIVIGQSPVIGVAKTAQVSGTDVTLDFYLENLGNTVLSSLSLTDDLNDAFGAGSFFVSTAPFFVDDPGTITLNGGYDGNFNTNMLTSGSSTLAAGDTAQIRMIVSVVSLNDLGSGIGVYENQATAYGVAPGGATSQDLSDNGTDPDPNGNGDPTEAGEDDATPITLASVSSIGIAKRYVSGGVSGGVPTVYLYFTIENTGNRELSSITVSDNLNAVYGAGNYSHLLDPEYISGSPTLTYNAAFNGNTNTSMITNGTLSPGDSTTFRIGSRITNITDQGFGLGVYQNQVTVNSLDPGANPVSDLSHEGSDPDPNGNGDPTEAGENDPTVIDVNETEEIGVAHDVSVSGNEVTMDFYLENLGTTTINQLDLIENLDSVFGAGNYAIQSMPTFIDDPGTILLETGYNGSDVIALFVPAGSSLVSGDTAQIRFVVQVTNIKNQGLGLGNYTSQATISGFSSLGSQVTDSSDSGTDPDPDGDGEANEAGENDATPIVLAVDTPIGVAVDAAVAGFNVTFDVYLENLGAGTLSSVSLINSLDDTFGAGNYTIIAAPAIIVDPGTLTLNGAYDGGAESDLLDASSTITAGATAQIQFQVSVDTESDQGGGYGVYSNQATASGVQTNTIVVSDFSDDGTDPDPNGNSDPSEAGEDDATAIVIAGNPAVGIAKKVYVNGTQATFDFYIENLGDVTLTNFLMTDPLNPVLGSGNYSIQTQPFQVSGPGTLSLSPQFFGFNIFDRIVVGGFLRPGETEHVRTIINVNTVSDQGNGFGVYLNGVTVTATGPDGTGVMDDSDDGTNPDPNGNGNAGDAGEDDDTLFTIGDEARIGVAKTATVVAQQVTFDLYLENLGGSTLNSITLEEDLDGVFGSGNYSLNGVPTFIDDPGTININAGFDGSATTALIDAGSTLAAMDTAQIRVVVDVTNILDQGLGFGNYSNQVTVTGTAPLGTLAEDISDNGTDPDPNSNGLANDDGEGDATTFMVGSAIVGAAKNATVSGRQVTFDYYIENLGDVTFNSVSMPDDFDAIFGAGNYTIISGPTLVSVPRFLVPNENFDGSTDTELVGSGAIGLGVTEQIRVVVEVNELVDNGSGLGVYSNQVTVTADGEMDLSDDGTDPDPNGNNNPTEAGENDPTAFQIAEDPVIGSAKNVMVSGRVVTIDMFLESFSNVELSNVALVEDLDAVFGAGNYSITSAPALMTDPGTLNLNGSFNGGGDPQILAAGSTLAQGATAQIRLVVTVDTVTDQGSGLGIYSNQVTASAQSPNATATNDLSDNGTVPDPNSNGDPTEAGENDASAIVLEGSIGGVVYEDLDGDGTQDGGEPAIAGVTVFLDLNSNGTLDGGEPSDTSDASGDYLFSDLAAATYSVEVDDSTVAANLVLTDGADPSSITLFAGEDRLDVDFGFQQQDASIGDFVWNDLDGDGVQDAGEPGLAGITVFLDLNSNGTLDGGEPSDVTDGSGAYDFTNLAAGAYSVRVDASTVPVGFVLITTNPLSVNLAKGEDYNDADFGYQQQDASIGDFVWIDLDGDGVQDGGEPGLAGVTVFLDLNSNGVLDGGEPSDTTDGTGAYDFTDLAAGTYSVRVDATTVTAGFVLTTGNNPASVNLAAGEDYNDADFGYQQQDASIGDFVWNDLDGDGVQDGGEPGLSGVTVFLDLNSNGVLDGGEPSDVTDGTGAYDFTDLATGTYSVRVDASTVSAGFVLTTANNPTSVNLAAGEDYNDADFGYQLQNASIGDVVWNDLDGDGVQDAGEPGLAGVTVFLDLNSNGTLDGGEPGDTTDGTGAYDFTGLATGTYSVRVDTSTLTAGFVLTTANNPTSVNLAAGQDYNDADFGYQQQDASIGDFVWSDLDSDGVQDGGEPGLSGVTVFLDLNSNGSLDGGEPSDVTDGTGAYDFTDLATGSYTVQVDLTTVPAGFNITTGNLPLVVSLAAGEDYNDADFGFQQQNASIGDFVWDDLNADGVFDAGEPGLAGVTVYLDLNANGMNDAGEPSATSDANGAYDITGLAAATYSILVSAVPSGYALTTGNLSLVVTLSPGEDFNDADFGYAEGDHASIGDFVWHDLDGDGNQDTGEPGLANVTLTLSNSTRGNPRQVIATQTTDANGAYLFDDLAAGEYVVEVTDDNGVLTDFVLSAGINPKSVNLANGQNLGSVDFGYCLPPSILEHPERTVVCVDSDATFTVVADGAAPLSYQWRKNGNDLPGETGDTLTLASVSLSDIGFYDCVVTNGCGTVTSNPALLVVRRFFVIIRPPRPQGLGFVWLTAIFSCNRGPVTFEWFNLERGERFGVDENPVTLSEFLTQPTEFQIRAVDEFGDVAEAEEVVLASQNEEFDDFNGDGCNTIEDLWALLEFYRTNRSDANGDGFIDIRDFLYINTGDEGERCGDN